MVVLVAHSFCVIEVEVAPTDHAPHGGWPTKGVSLPGAVRLARRPNQNLLRSERKIKEINIKSNGDFYKLIKFYRTRIEDSC